MGKIVIYNVIVLITLFFLEFFQLIDIPYLEIPDYLSTKKERFQETEEAVDQLE